MVKRVFACVAAWLLCTCIVNAIGNRNINAVDKRNVAKNFAESNVFFGIQKTRNKPELVGKENVFSPNKNWLGLSIKYSGWIVH